MIRWLADRWENRNMQSAFWCLALLNLSLLSSRGPFDVAFNLHNAAWVANGVERLLQRREESAAGVHLSGRAKVSGWDMEERRARLMAGETSTSCVSWGGGGGGGEVQESLSVATPGVASSLTLMLCVCDFLNTKNFSLKRYKSKKSSKFSHFRNCCYFINILIN